MRDWGVVLVTLAALLNATDCLAARFPLRAGSTARMVATAYCLENHTESGLRPRTGVIAADPHVLPIGSVVRVLSGPRPGVYTVLDTGRAVKGLKLDIFIKDCRRAKAFGKRTIRVRVLQLSPR